MVIDVLTDKNLTIEAKAIYVYIIYFSSFEIYPSVEKMCNDLNIGHERLLKHRRLLEKYGYIKIIRNKENGRYGKNKYEV